MPSGTWYVTESVMHHDDATRRVVWCQCTIGCMHGVVCRSNLWQGVGCNKTSMQQGHGGQLHPSTPRVCLDARQPTTSPVACRSAPEPPLPAAAHHVQPIISEPESPPWMLEGLQQHQQEWPPFDLGYV
jgi:hypothetical protein